MTPLVLSVTRTDIRLRTEAKGLLSTLAHDLELLAMAVSGEATEGASPRARLQVSTALSVVGVVKSSAVRTDVLSPSDRAEIERRVREELFPGGEKLEIDVSLDGDKATIALGSSRGRQTVRSTVSLEREGSDVTARGACTVSIAALGLGTIKGPLGVFKIKDEVTVTFRAVFQPALPTSVFSAPSTSG